MVRCGFFVEHWRRLQFSQMNFLSIKNSQLIHFFGQKYLLGNYEKIFGKLSSLVEI